MKTTQNQHQQTKTVKSFPSRLSDLQEVEQCLETAGKAYQGLEV